MAVASENGKQSFFHRWKWVIVGFVVACTVVLVLAPAASSDPDGLDRVSGDKGFSHHAEGPRYEWLPDYTIPGVHNEWASVVMAGLVGVGIVFVVTLGLGAVARRSRKGDDS
ncbi:MAG: PDGLE domain-containing protein [Dehalococcoidia bacterium]|nr:PDGLE domain-containing protein [Dehalococcoidia bacterium]